MGLFQVDALVTGPTGAREHLSLLVDTGATFLVIPQTVADRLHLHPTDMCSLQLAGGRRDVWPLAEVRLHLGEREVTTPCLIAPEGQPLLGAVALESLRLAVDPVAKRLVPVDAFIGRARPGAASSSVEEAF